MAIFPRDASARTPLVFGAAYMPSLSLFLSSPRIVFSFGTNDLPRFPLVLPRGEPAKTRKGLPALRDEARDEERNRCLVRRKGAAERRKRKEARL